MPYTVTIKQGDSKYVNGKWVDVDSIQKYPELKDALFAFLVAIDDGYDSTTLKHKRKPNKDGNK